MSFVTELNERLTALPGLKSVGMADSLPLTPVGRVWTIYIEGKLDLKAQPDDPAPLGDGPSAFLSRVSPGYFGTLGIPLRQGREFGPQDRQGSLLVAVINEALAQRCFPGENPLGKRLLADGGGWRTVVGVVGNIKRFALEDQPKPELYMPSLQPRGSSRETEAALQASPKGSKIPTTTHFGKFSPTATQGQSSYVSLMVRASV